MTPDESGFGGSICCYSIDRAWRLNPTPFGIAARQTDGGVSASNGLKGFS
jgi:hypothetical protein